MAKRKSKAVIMAADGAGGMVPVLDRRFDQGDWPVQFHVPREAADTWLQYLSAECRRRGWSLASFGQIEAKENSGSITVSTATAEPLALAVVWERKRGGPLRIRARSAGTSEFPVAQAEELFEQVNVRCRAGTKEEFYRRGHLSYKGLPWLGELWLSDTLRLGPPSGTDGGALFGPRIIVIDTKVEGIDLMDALAAFDVMLRELSVFLSVLMGREVRVPSSGERAWTWIVAPSGQVESDVRNLGYYQRDNPAEIPAKGYAPSVPLVPVRRPDLSIRGITVGDNEQQLPSDRPLAGVQSTASCFAAAVLAGRQHVAVGALGRPRLRDHPICLDGCRVRGAQTLGERVHGSQHLPCSRGAIGQAERGSASRRLVPAAGHPKCAPPFRRV
jgi:hypothetical protein